MRRSIPLASFLCCWLLAARPACGGAAADSSEALGRWLPAPEEELESPEKLEEAPAGDRSGALVRGAVTRGRYRTRRVSLRGKRSGMAGEVAFLIDERRVRPGARIEASGGRAALAAGRVSVTRAPPLLAAAMKLAAAGRRVLAPRWGAISASPSLGASAGAIDGGAASWHAGRALIWSFAGTRSGARQTLVGLGIGLARGGTRIAAAYGAVGAARHRSITVIRRGQDGSVAVEALDGTAGRALSAEATARGAAVLLAARWRYRSWDARPVAAEISAESRGSGPRARLTWRSWSASAAGADADDGILELEGTESPDGSGRVKVRLGGAGLGGSRAGAGPHEGYAFLDAVLARGNGRSLSAHVLRRVAGSASSSASSTTVGARLDLGKDGGGHSLLVESTRLARNAPAWGIAISPSGDVTLRSRSRPGLWVTARGEFGPGRARLGYALERGEDAAGPKPWNGTVWIRLAP